MLPNQLDRHLRDSRKGRYMCTTYDQQGWEIFRTLLERMDPMFQDC